MPLVTCIHTSTANIYIFFLMALQSNGGHGLLIHEVSRSHTTMHRR